MERDRFGTFSEQSLQLIRRDTKVQRALGVISGILIGTGVGGWVAAGMRPSIALAFILPGSIVALEGAQLVLEKQRFEKFREDVISQTNEPPSAHK